MNSINKIVYIKDSSETNVEVNKNITRYNVIAPHKCGSTILNKILQEILGEPTVRSGTRGIFRKVDSTNSAVEHESVEYRFSRLMPEDHQSQDKCIFIPRNPISMSISMFYSYAYTHAKPHNSMSEEEWQKRCAKRQKMGCEKFVEECISRNCAKIKELFDSDCDKTIIPYELMVSNFELFLQKFLESLNLTDYYDETFHKFKGDFGPIEDKSDDIVAGNYKGHKRTTDINEWQSKFDEATLSRYMDKHSIIKEYHDYVQSFNLEDKE